APSPTRLAVPVVSPAVSPGVPRWRWADPLPQGNPLYGVWGSSATDVYAVGGGHTMLHSRDGGASWQPIAVPGTGRLVAVWGSSADDVYVAGDEIQPDGAMHGAVLHSIDRGLTWQRTIVASSGLWSLWGRSADEVYATGWDAVIVRSRDRGATWQPLAT